MTVMHRHLHPVGPPATGSSLLGIVLAEDHPIMRHSLRLVLDAEREMVVLAEATDLETATRDVHRFHPHVLLLDLNLPNGAGTDTIRLLRRDAPGTQVVVGFDHPNYAHMAVLPEPVRAALSEDFD